MPWPVQLSLTDCAGHRYKNYARVVTKALESLKVEVESELEARKVHSERYLLMNSQPICLMRAL